MASLAGGAHPFVGRDREVERIRSLLDAARDGRSGALLVSGDAGVGKTRLVHHAVATASTGVGTGPDDLLVLTGVCLPMGTTTVPLMPLRTAFRRLPGELRPPTLDPGGASSPGGAPVAVDDWLEEVCAERAVVVVVEDVHWADPGSLDVLTYLLAGPADRRLAVIATLRRGEVTIGHPVQRWLDDVRRMPALNELALHAFDREGTRDMLAAGLGAAPHESLVTAVHARSEGNAYFTGLLVQDLPPDARHLGDGLPDDLRSAVLRPWTRLSVDARALVLGIAVGGEVAAGPALRRAAELVGVEPTASPPLLREAVEGGVLDVLPHGGHWFHHPLQAEALDASLTAEERRQLHASLAASCAADLADSTLDGASALAATSAVAEHHVRAGLLREAYAWTERAAATAEALGQGVALLGLVQRLVDLQPRVPDSSSSRLELLDRLRAVAAGLGDHESELGAVAALLEEVSAADDPLLVSELLVRMEHLRFSTGRGFLRVEPPMRAAELARPWPDSWQLGYALAEVAHAKLWAEAPDAQSAVAEALEQAVAGGHPRALAYAYATAAMGTEFLQEPGAGELARRGVEAAVETQDWWAFVHATLWEANASDWGTHEWVRVCDERRRQLEELGAPHAYIGWLAASEAGMLVGTGDWRGTGEQLRVALGSDPGAAVDVSARLAAAHLATLQGRQHEAEDHLARADELFGDTSGFLPFEFDAVRSRVRLGAGDLEGAFEAAMTGARSPGAPPTFCELLCPLAARALAGLADAAREVGGSPDAVLARLEDLVADFPHVIADNALVSETYAAQLAGLDGWYAAEVARARHDVDEASQWAQAARLLDGQWPWDAAYAAFRAGESLLVGGGSRDEAAGFLHRAWELATELRAEPVRREVRALAATARVRLDDPPAATPAVVEPPALPGLTPREREVLEHVVAGRTYGEIARALFVSEKTVSSHISNLLRKTGTANRVELARLARHAATTTPDG